MHAQFGMKFLSTCLKIKPFRDGKKSNKTKRCIQKDPSGSSICKSWLLSNNNNATPYTWAAIRGGHPKGGYHQATVFERRRWITVGGSIERRRVVWVCF